eukprot:CAMPEP_0197684722 /NCGR_PEP_ID=MMETSP1338-20131121/99876_1 /TAXON_ID=43686 ORGANISM="Pelagodinium beii, Strain RCC1491" /NCGR_SAMPLE_ID=MMETSP1338 /ASSEMBLY_ACC=CAM_ASM_000754 /LENGTH=84 /DNA_ID=CAMNT_0043266465 /DNA_START=47 /DNA_END=299 /DNA_ORIENTATION=-
MHDTKSYDRADPADLGIPQQPLPKKQPNQRKCSQEDTQLQPWHRHHPKQKKTGKEDAAHDQNLMLASSASIWHSTSRSASCGAS